MPAPKKGVHSTKRRMSKSKVMRVFEEMELATQPQLKVFAFEPTQPESIRYVYRLSNNSQPPPAEDNG